MDMTQTKTKLTSADLGTSSNLATLISEDLFNEMFPNRNYYLTVPHYPAYQGITTEIVTYDGLIEASKSFPDFCNVGSEQDRKRELAAFLGNASQETTVGWGSFDEGSERYLYGLGLTIEGGSITPSSHQQESRDFPPVGNESYQGRGALQLSYNPNYGLFSEFEFGDKNTLLRDPDIVGLDPLLFWKSAIWFWMTRERKDTPDYWNKPSCHEAITGQYQPEPYQTTHYGIKDGYGLTIIVINGGVEGKTNIDQLKLQIAQGEGDAEVLEKSIQDIQDKVKSRIGFYKRYCKLLGVDAGEEDTLSSLTMAQYPQQKA